MQLSSHSASSIRQHLNLRGPRFWLASALLCAGSLQLTGCGQKPAGEIQQTAAPAHNAAEQVSPASALFDPNQALRNSGRPQVQPAVANDDDWEKELLNDADEKLAGNPSDLKALGLAEPEAGSPEWKIREITKLRTLPMNIVRQPVPGKPNEFQNVQLPPEQVAAERLRRSEQIIELASEVVALTHQDAARSQLFNNAIHYLADARLERALEGDQDQAAALHDDAEVLFKRDPKSFAAVETAYRVLQLTHTQAQKFGQSEPRWTQALARQARVFAQRFPQENSRAALFLITAGKLCDEQGLIEEAKTCLGLVQTDFAKTPFGTQADGVLRRLNLPGQTLADFGGSTHDGGFVEIQQLRGKAVLVVFWESSSAQFQKDLPQLKQALASAGDRVTVIGVNLDRDEVKLDQFLETNQLDWRQIFYSDPQKRGPENMVAKHYGVAHGPQYWLVGPDGVVRSVAVKPNQLAQMLGSP